MFLVGLLGGQLATPEEFKLNLFYLWSQTLVLDQDLVLQSARWGEWNVRNILTKKSEDSAERSNLGIQQQTIFITTCDKVN